MASYYRAFTPISAAVNYMDHRATLITAMDMESPWFLHRQSSREFPPRIGASHFINNLHWTTANIVLIFIVDNGPSEMSSSNNPIRIYSMISSLFIHFFFKLKSTKTILPKPTNPAKATFCLHLLMGGEFVNILNQTVPDYLHWLGLME